MAKSARSSDKKNNNQRLKKNVFGPAEAARAERLSAKLLELAKAPKPSREADVNMEEADDDAQINPEEAEEEAKQTEDTSMEVDSTKPRRRSGRIQKQKKTSKIVFPKYKDRRGGSKKKN